MSLKQRRIYKALAVFLWFSFAQVYIQTSFAVQGGTRVSVPLPQQFVARLSTRNNQPITVNGASASSGASVLTGATIETPDQVGATIDFGALGTLDLAPNTIVSIEFDQNGLKVTLKRGCAVVKSKNGEILTDQGSVGKTNSSKKKLSVCYVPGAAPTIDAAAAGAAAAGAGAAATAGGLSGAALTAILIGVGGTATGLAIALRGNSSP